MIDFVTWPPLQITNDSTKGGQVTVGHSCENTLQEKYHLKEKF